MSVKKYIRRAAAMLILLLIVLTQASCANKSNEAVSETSTNKAAELTATISKHPKFDYPELNLTEEDFSKAGFSFGDSCDVKFSNGASFEDVPYFNGFYVKTGELVIVAYPKNKYVGIVKNNSDFWSTEGFDDSCTVEITLNTPGKYIATQEALGQSYSVDRKDYESDEQFANFRALSGGKLKKDFLYRGASPVDNSRGRAAVADKLVRAAGIKCIIDLADSEEDMLGYFKSEDFDSSYTKELYENGDVVLLSMGANHDSKEYKESVAKGMRHLLRCGGPAYIHCMEGKDRTGFVCLLIEALAGADYDEMCADYMTTYANYYGITLEKTPDRYNAVVSLYFDSFLEYLTGTEDESKLRSADYEEAAKKYLTECGMTQQEIKELKGFLTE